LNITMKRRPGRDFLNFMLPDNLNVLAGTTVGVGRTTGGLGTSTTEDAATTACLAGASAGSGA
jgi:hypothetical protein